MSAVETAPPRPPRPVRPKGMLNSKKGVDKNLGLSLDLESVDFSDPFTNNNETSGTRKRSMTLDSSHRHSYKKDSSHQPHIIDSSKASSLTTMSDTPPKVGGGGSPAAPEKPKPPMPLTRPPNRPPRPQGFSRSSSQPQGLKDRVGLTPKEDVAGQRRRSADLIVPQKSPPVALQRFSSVGSSEPSPLPDVPEGESANHFQFSPGHNNSQPMPTVTTPTTNQPLTPTCLQGAPPPRPPPSQVPPRPIRPKSPLKPPSKATPTPPSQSPPAPISPSSSATQLPSLRTPSPTDRPATLTLSPPSPDSLLPDFHDQGFDSIYPLHHPPPRATSPLEAVHLRERSSTSPSVMITEELDGHDNDDREQGGVESNRLSLKACNKDTDSPSSSPSATTTKPNPTVPPRPFMPPRPFPPNSRGQRMAKPPQQARRGTAPVASLRQISSDMKAKKEAGKSGQDRPKRPTHHHRQRPPPPKPGQDPPQKPPVRGSPKLQFIESGKDSKSVIVPNSVEASPTKVASKQPTAPPTSGRSSEEDAKDRRKKLVSFRSTDSIVPDQDEEKAETPEEQLAPLPTVPESSSPNKGRKLVNSMKKGFSSLRIKSKKAPSSPGRRGRQVESTSSRTNIDIDENDQLPQGMIDPIVLQCVAYLNRENVLLEEGLFRVPGDLASIRRLRQDFMRGQEVDLSNVLDPHTVAGLLKLHFREQKTSILPRGPPLTVIMEHVRNRDVEGVCAQLGELDIVTMSTLSIVVEMLAKVTSHSITNLMTAGTLATSCGPSLFPYLPPSSANQITKFLVDNCQDIFHPNEKPMKKDRLASMEEEDNEEVEWGEEYNNY